jgi:hypothetical protein
MSKINSQKSLLDLDERFILHRIDTKIYADMHMKLLFLVILEEVVF